MSKRMTLPQTGRAQGDILAQMRDFKGGDVDWKNGRAPLFVFKATDEAYEVGRAASSSISPRTRWAHGAPFRASSGWKTRSSRWRSICSMRRRARKAS